MHVIKRLTANYDTPRQYLNSTGQIFWYSSSFGITWPSNFGCSTFDRRILPLTRSRPAVLYGAYFSSILAVTISDECLKWLSVLRCREYGGRWRIAVISAAAARVLRHQRGRITIGDESESRQRHSASLPTDQSRRNLTFTLLSCWESNLPRTAAVFCLLSWHCWQMLSVWVSGICCCGPTVWNSLSDDLHYPTLSTDSFRRLLKTRLFSEY